MGFIKMFTYKCIMYIDYIYTCVHHDILYLHACTLYVLTIFVHVHSPFSLFTLPFVSPDNFVSALMACTCE